MENVINIRRQLLKLNERSQGKGSEKLTKRQCKVLYPGENDSTIVFCIEEKLGSRRETEVLLALCNYDFSLARSIAEEAASLFHYNMKLFKSLYKKFDKNVNEVMEYLRKFNNHQPQNAETTHCKAALETLSAFKNEWKEASKYLSLFKDNGITASSFLSRFQNDTTKAKNFIEKFMNDGERADEYLKWFKDVHEANEFLDKFSGQCDEANRYLKKFKNMNEANEFLKKFDGNGNKANQFIREFNGSPDCASTFIQSFNTPKEALEHFESINKECDEKADNSCGDKCKWIFDEKTKMLFIRGSGEMKDYEFKNGAPITPWSSRRVHIENVVMSEEITTIGKYAFCECSSLTSVTIPNSVVSIGRSGFWGCSKLTPIHIHKNVKEIGERAFAECSNLSTITVDEKNEYFKSADSVLFTKDGTKLTRYALTKTETSYIIPDGVVVIDDSAFDRCSHLESVTIPDSVTTIEDFAFNECSSLKTINIPESVKTIGYGVFQYCSSLTSISIPKNVETMKDDAFNLCSNLSIANIPKKFQERKDKIFGNCPKLETINWIE